MDADGKNRTRLSKKKWDDMPAWSPDGHTIAFISSVGGQRGIFVMDSYGNGRKRLTGNPAIDCLPVWSPDGKKLAFLSDRGWRYRWWVMDRDGSGQHVMADTTVFETEVDAPYILLRGVWLQSTLPEQIFLAPMMTRKEKGIIAIDVEKGSRIGLNFKGIFGVAETIGNAENKNRFLVGTIWSADSKSYDLVAFSSRTRRLTNGPQQEFVSSAVFINQ
jgi:hypothetical protein